MKVSFLLRCLMASLLLCGTSLMQTAKAQADSARQLAGLWEAKRRSGSDVGGLLIIRQANNEWRAEISGRTGIAKLEGDAISFELPGGRGSFRGKFDERRTKIFGHWIQPATSENGTSYASPVTLNRDRRNVWRGEVSPLPDTITFYLMVKPREDGTVGAFLRNPERNLGRFIRIDHLEREGEIVKLFAADTADAKGRVLAAGRYDDQTGVLSLFFPMRGATFDFQRVEPNAMSDFYPRGRPTASYVYAPPTPLDDGWQTASVEQVGISRARIEKFIQMLIDTPIDSVNSQEMHGVLIARRGKLVLEEYFHGEHRDKPHDTRSAAKSLTATLVGASIKAGIPVDVSTPVYQVMNGGAFPTDLEPRKKALTVESLLTMSSGLDCDDADAKSPGNEENMLEQTAQPGYYKFALDLKMVRQPGEKAVYCSVQPNLVGGVLQSASRQFLPVLFQNLIAEPLAIKRYYLNLTPTGDAYMGGSVRFLPRDFMKLGQLHLNGGTWNGRRILTPEWTRRATSHVVNIDKTTAYNWQTQRMETGTRKYGYLWWVEDYPYKGRTVRAFFAAGNGGQIVLGIPELDLVIAFYGGNYADRGTFIPQWIYVPQYILPAIDN
ncbi:MAG TPA: serine hydrolase [Pyrinomonadaceae bacterium]|nr:serine hydrolase [Pyrinomonadaceae bacterium]